MFRPHATVAFAAAALALPSLALAGGGETKAGGSLWSDSDGDGVHDSLDLCPGTDDDVDLDADGAADCSQTFVGTGAFDSFAEGSAWLGSNAWTSTQDGNGYAPSGALNLSTTTMLAHGLSPCVAVSSNTQHELLAQVYAFNGTQPVDVKLQVWEYADTTCSSSSPASTPIDQITSNTNGWSVMGGRFLMGTGTGSVRVVVVNSPVSTTMTDVYFDNILLHDNVLTRDEDDGGAARD